MRRKRRFKLLAIALTVLTSAIFIGALATAETGGDPTAQAQLTDPSMARASRAAAALADAHPGDRAVSVLADVAQREIVGSSGAPSVLDSFSVSAEEHIVSDRRHPAKAQQLLRDLVRQLRGGDSTVQPAQPGAAAEITERKAYGQNLVIERGETVEEAAVLGGNLTIRGHVLGDAVCLGGNIRLETGARVDGDVVSMGGNVQVDPGARIDGDTSSLGGRVTVAEGAWVDGDRNQFGRGALTGTLPFAETEESAGSRFVGWVSSTAKTVGLGIVMALLGIVMAALAPNRVRNTIATIRGRPMLAFLSGLLALLVVIPATVVLAITILGIALIPVLWAAVAFASLFGLTGVATLLGEVLPGRGKAGRTGMRCILLGAAVLTVIALLPFGWFVIGLVMTLSLGAVILSRVGAVQPS